VSRIKVLVAAVSLDMTAEGIFTAVAQRDDMTLVESRIVTTAEVDALLETLPLSGDCAVVLVGSHVVTEQSAASWLAQYKNLVVLRVDIIGDIVRSRPATSVWTRCWRRCASSPTAPALRRASGFCIFNCGPCPPASTLAPILFRTWRKSARC
jgi:hypothetical protein